MRKRLGVWLGLGVLALSAGGGLAWCASLPPAPASAQPAAIPAEETAAALAALKPPKRARPLVAIVGVNDHTEVTDYLMPYGILRRADVADVMALSTEAGPVNLYPALRVEADATIAEFEARHPDGADYVIVPAMMPDDDPKVLDFIRSQAARGATIVGVCVGATVVAETGLLDGRRATTHWWSLRPMLKARPEIRYVADRRYVVDRGVATTTGITASMPMTLTLIEAIAGRAKAEEVARELGVPAWDARHDSGAFRFNRPFALTVIGNRAAFWRQETLGMEIAPGVDEVALALAADSWSRTFRSRAVTLAEGTGPVVSRSGLRILPDRASAGWTGERLPPAMWGRRPAEALDATLEAIADRYGPRTADVVAMQLEYPKRWTE
ncbi:DJ-1/PfpI family protein [Phenylobacterium terrae]|uniref:DJ-1/PfpI family protein n=1 Tax=Phenylobacterium terrae TaxID=2665495 RepID=A0ABW4MW56_9CAUL